MKSIINLHRMDLTNIGDYYASPMHYFSFPNCTVEHKEIVGITPAMLSAKHVIVGGGGLLDEWFQPSFQTIRQSKAASLTAWGPGQQLDRGPWFKQHHAFNYPDYLSGFSLIGIRDYEYGYPWVPCASCMHPLFDKPREIKHDFVVFSHKSRPIPISGFPELNNETNNLEEVLEFLSSGETIITSSYHGAYWGTLLNRKVLAFPFNSKFFTFRHQPAIYPSIWKRKRSILGLGASSGYALEMVKGWRFLAGTARNYPGALAECRAANEVFHDQFMSFLSRSGQ